MLAYLEYCIQQACPPLQGFSKQSPMRQSHPSHVPPKHKSHILKALITVDNVCTCAYDLKISTYNESLLMTLGGWKL